jgi:UDP-glucose 4-epimerase
MRVLVTGATGFIGGRIVLALRARNIDVVCGTRNPDIIEAGWCQGLETVRMDWQSLGALTRSCAGFDVVVHLAAMNEVESAINPVAALEVNAVNSLRLLEAVKLSGVSRLIYFSTAHIYGSPLVGEITERSLPRPTHPYSISHRVVEDYVLAAHDTGEFEGVVVRLSNGFGVPAHLEVKRWSLLVNDLCRQVVKQRELRLRTSGLQHRDFITLSDVGRAVDHLIRADSSTIADGLFNLGSGKSMTVLEMAKLIAIRSKETLNIDIPIVRPQAEDLTATPLAFSVDKIIRTGLKLTCDFESEIDKILLLFSEWPERL